MKIWEVYPRLFVLVRNKHNALEMDGTGHPFDHVVQVAQSAITIAQDDTTARLAGAAAMCHNADRLLQKEKDSNNADSEAHVTAKMIPREETVGLIQRWLDASGEFGARERERIVSAVLLHSGPNVADCDPILIALQDADRIVCSMASAIMDAAQFWKALPSIDPKWITADPSDGKFNNYRTPKSAAHNLECRYDWIDRGNAKFCVRLPKALDFMERRAGFYRQYLAEIANQRAEIGLYPDYPAEA